MNKIFQLLKNIKYLSEINLRTYTSATTFLTQPNELKYSILQQFYEKQLYMLPQIKTYDETLDLLINSNCSIARFGEGEFRIILGQGIQFQEFTPILQKRLKEVLICNSPNIYIGIPKVYFNISTLNQKLDVQPREFILNWFLPQEEVLKNFLDMSKTYIPTEITQMYMHFADYDFAQYFEKLKNIWKGKDIVIVCGDRVFNNIEKNIFDCASSVEYVYCPTTNAFSQYDEILNNLKKINNSKLIIMILGPTATVLAYDLNNLGYRALDFGHIAKNYDAYCKKIIKDYKNIAKFFDAD